MYYENGFESCYDELMKFYPVFYKDIFEMNEILKAYGSLTDAVQKNIEVMLEDNYIQTADEPTIARLENFLYINTDKTKSLDERRKLVLSFFVGFGKISASKIKSIIKNFTNSEADVQFRKSDEKGNNYLYVTCDRGTEDNLKVYDIADVLVRKIPAHVYLNLLIRYAFECSENNKNYVGTAVRVKMRSAVFDSGL